MLSVTTTGSVRGVFEQFRGECTDTVYYRVEIVVEKYFSRSFGEKHRPVCGRGAVRKGGPHADVWKRGRKCNSRVQSGA